jgi:hypothetical protein
MSSKPQYTHDCVTSVFSKLRDYIFHTTLVNHLNYDIFNPFVDLAKSKKGFGRARESVIALATSRRPTVN